MKVEVKKARLQHNIWEYTKRQNKTIVAEKKLRSWKKSYKIIEEGQNRAIKLGKIIEEFMGQSVCSNSLLNISNKDKNVRNSLALYYKYGLMQNIPQRFLLWYTGKKSSSCVYDTKNNFTEELKTNEYSQQLWINFKNYARERITKSI